VGRDQFILTPLPATTGRIVCKGSVRSGGKLLDYRRRSKQWQIAEEHWGGELPDNTDVEEFVDEVKAYAMLLTEPKISFETERDLYGAEFYKLTIRGWRPADESEIKIIERSRRKAA